MSDDLLIVMWRYHKSTKWYRTLVSKAIVFFTKSPYTHVGIYYDGYLYESTVMNNQNGTMVTEFVPEKNDRLTYMRFKKPLTSDQLSKLYETLWIKVVVAQPYNFLKLFVLMLVYPTKKFWNKIGWVPFQSEFFGNVCSVFVDSVFKTVGIDLLPGQNEEYTAPGDFYVSPMLEVVKWE